MKRNIFSFSSIKLFFRLVAAVLVMIMLVQCIGFSALAKDDGKMAYNIYSDPDVSKTSGGFDTFSIDFRGVQTPESTYWALANWGMDLSGSLKQYPGATGGGAYAGLQNTNQKVAIMSFWEISYNRGKKIMRASRMYPAGVDNNFGGEGEGTNWITPYPWKDNEWYRMVLHCWKDSEKGTTFVGEWFQEQSSGEWRLISYFDTHLYDSFFKGNMSQFMENFYSGNADYEREFNYKNFYVLDHKDGQWKSLASSTLSYDSGATNKRGTHSFGATDEYFWGKSNGILPEGETQESYNKGSTTSKKYTIKQPSTPTFGDPSIESLKIKEKNGEWKIRWNMEKTGTPQLSYKLELLDKDGNVVQSQSATRPEVKGCSFDVADGEALLCRLTVTDVFGKECVAEQGSEAYLAGENGDNTQDNSSEANENDAADNNKTSKTLIIAVCSVAAVIAAVVAVVTGIVLGKKKKAKK